MAKLCTAPADYHKIPTPQFPINLPTLQHLTLRRIHARIIHRLFGHVQIQHLATFILEGDGRSGFVIADEGWRNVAVRIARLILSQNSRTLYSRTIDGFPTLRHGGLSISYGDPSRGPNPSTMDIFTRLISEVPLAHRSSVTTLYYDKYRDDGDSNPSQILLSLTGLFPNIAAARLHTDSAGMKSAIQDLGSSPGHTPLFPKLTFLTLWMDKEYHLYTVLADSLRSRRVHNDEEQFLTVPLEQLELIGGAIAQIFLDELTAMIPKSPLSGLRSNDCASSVCLSECEECMAFGNGISFKHCILKV